MSIYQKKSAWIFRRSGAVTLDAADAFKNTFGCSNVVKGYNRGYEIPVTNRNTMVNLNLLPNTRSC